MSFICHILNYTEYNQQWNLFSVHTHLEQWTADTAAPGEQLGVRCLAQGAHLSRGQFLPEPRFKPTTSGDKSNALSIRPRLPSVGNSNNSSWVNNSNSNNHSLQPRYADYHLWTHKISNPEADGLQQQKTTRRLQFTQAHQNWTVEDRKNISWSDESWFLLRHSDGRVRIWCKEHESMDPSCLVSMVQAGGGGVMVWGIFSWHTLGPLVPIEHCLNATAYLSIVADHVLTFMTTVYSSSDVLPAG